MRELCPTLRLSRCYVVMENALKPDATGTIAFRTWGSASEQSLTSTFHRRAPRSSPRIPGVSSATSADSAVTVEPMRADDSAMRKTLAGYVVRSRLRALGWARRLATSRPQPSPGRGRRRECSAARSCPRGRRTRRAARRILDQRHHRAPRPRCTRLGSVTVNSYLIVSASTRVKRSTSARVGRRALQARLAAEVDRLDDERVAFPAAARVARPLAKLGVRTAVGRDDAGVVHHLVDDHHVARAPAGSARCCCRRPESSAGRS